MCHIGYMSRLELFYFSNHLPGWVAEHVTLFSEIALANTQSVSREQNWVAERRSSARYVDLQLFQRWRRKTSPVAPFVFVPQEVSPYIRVSPKLSLYVTLGMIYFPICDKYITSTPILCGFRLNAALEWPMSAKQVRNLFSKNKALVR